MHRWLAGILLLGAALSLVQQCAISDEVFFSGDGGIKSLMAKQFARGDWHADLRLDAEPWVRELWRDGLYPFGQPFAIEVGERRYVSFAVPFMALTAPFYRWLGFRGLTVLPLLGLWLAWCSAARILLRLDLSSAARTVGLAGLVLASFLTPYGAMYWEHSLAVGISCAGFSLIFPTVPDRGRIARSLASGLLMGIAIWLRPESAAFAAGACLALPLFCERTDVRLAVPAGVAVAGIAFAVFNQSLYGHLLGLNGMREMEEFHIGYTPGHEIVWFYFAQFLRLCPVGLVAGVLAIAGLRIRALRADAMQAALWIVIGTTFFGAAFLSRHSGGDQIGSRYVLHALPPFFVLVSLQWNAIGALEVRWRRVARIAVSSTVLVGIYLNSVLVTEALYENYRGRSLPALESIRADGNRVVAVHHQWMAQELASAFENKIFFRLRSQRDFDLLSRKLLDRGTSRFTLISYQDQEPGVYRAEGFDLRLHPRGRFGELFLIDAELIRTAGRADAADPETSLGDPAGDGASIARAVYVMP